MRLILASASPRRAELLRAAGIPFEVSPVEIDERFHAGETPEAAVGAPGTIEGDRRRRAAIGDAIVLGADTTVVVSGEALGKAGGRCRCIARMLRLLSGRAHEVLTGVCLCAQGRTTRACRADARARRATVRGRHRLVRRDGRALPTRRARTRFRGSARGLSSGIDGSYSNVVGLPISSVYERLKDLGCDILGSTKTS